MLVNMYDVHVVGAGPAGSFAAITALRNGKNVLLSEEHKKVGTPVHCSGLVSSSGLARLSDVVAWKKIIKNKIMRANVHGKSEHFCLSFPAPKAYVIDRGEFDRLAAEKYLDEGGNLALSHKVQKISDLKSKNIIGADGPISTVSRIFSFPKIENYCACWQGEFSHSSPDTGAVEVFFNPDLCPGFIGWIIPLDSETAEIGLGVSCKKDLHLAKKEFLHKLKISKKPFSEFSALIPLSARRITGKQSGGYNACLCGDSAGQVKATTGGGIFFGTQCARIAAQKFERPHAYEKKWREKYGADLALHSAARIGIDALTADGIDLWLKSVKFAKLDRLLCEMGEMDEYSKMLSHNAIMSYLKLITTRQA